MLQYDWGNIQLGIPELDAQAKYPSAGFLSLGVLASTPTRDMSPLRRHNSNGAEARQLCIVT